MTWKPSIPGAEKNRAALRPAPRYVSTVSGSFGWEAPARVPLLVVVLPRIETVGKEVPAHCHAMSRKLRQRPFPSCSLLLMILRPGAETNHACCCWPVKVSAAVSRNSGASALSMWFSVPRIPSTAQTL